MTSPLNRSRPARRAGLLATGLVTGAAALVLGAVPAFAHVDAEGAPAAGGATEVTFSFEHGCDGSPTTSLRIQLPAGTTDVKPEEVAGFTAEASTTELSWKGGSIPDDTHGSFTATMKLTGQPGDTVYFPTIQGCAQGEESWIDKTPDPETPNAAPRIVLSASDASTTTTGAADHDHDAASTTSAPATSTTAKATTSSTAAASTTSGAVAASSTTTVAPATTSTSSSGPSAGLIAAIIIALVVVVGLVLWLVRRNQGPKDDPAAPADAAA